MQNIQHVAVKHPAIIILIIGGLLSALALGYGFWTSSKQEVRPASTGTVTQPQTQTGKTPPSKRHGYQTDPLLAEFKDFTERTLKDGSILVKGSFINNTGMIVFMSDRGAVATSTAIYSESFVDTRPVSSGAPRMPEKIVSTTSVNIGFGTLPVHGNGIRFNGIIDEECQKTSSCTFGVFYSLGDGAPPAIKIPANGVPEADLEKYVVEGSKGPLKIAVGKDVYTVDLFAKEIKLVKASK